MLLRFYQIAFALILASQGTCFAHPQDAANAEPLAIPPAWAGDSTEVRKELPERITVPAADPQSLTPASGWPPQDYFHQWTRSHGNSANTRYSALTGINKDNVASLRVAWTYHSGDLRAEWGRNLQANPIIVDRMMIAPTIGHALVAVNAATGEEIWRFQPDERWVGREGEYTAQRGLVYWQGDSQHPGRVYFNAGQHLYCLEARSGHPVPTFGEGGRTRTGVVAVAGAIYRDVIVVPSKSESAIFGYDIHTGLLRWRFNTVPQLGERNYDPQGGTRWNAFCWGGLALDESRGLVFFGLSDPNLDAGSNISGHLTRNLYANCVLALQAETGEYVWHFQEMPHDIWDTDIPSPPILVTVEREGRQVDAVAALTKMGNTLLLDRTTGRPLFDFRMRRAPVSALPGVKTWPYQPDPELPEPFADVEFHPSDVTERSPEAHAAVLKQIEGATWGRFQPFQKPDQKVVYFGVHGGADWPGGCFDPETATVYVSANHIPWTWSVTDYRRIRGERFGEGAAVYSRTCAVCHGPDRRGIGNASSLVGLGQRYTDRSRVEEIIRKGTGNMPPVTGIEDRDIQRLLQYLYAEGEPPEGGEPEFVYSGLKRLRDHEELPGSKPPWGTLAAIDLNSGRIRWQVPLGEHPGAPDEIQPTGVENFGGPVVTAGGLVFCAGTKDHLIRAFDKDTGAELWRHQLPFGGYAPPTVYSIDGRPYVVIAASSGGNPGGRLGDTYVAFTLP